MLYHVIATCKRPISLCCFVEDGTGLFLSSCRTCSTVIFPHSTNQIIDLGSCRRRCCRQFLNFVARTGSARWTEAGMKASWGGGGGGNVKPAFISNTIMRTYHMGMRIFALKIGSSVQNSFDLASSLSTLWLQRLCTRRFHYRSILAFKVCF